MITTFMLLILCSTSLGMVPDEPSDILVADFEWETWGERGWSTTGEAFGPGPSPGTLPGQMEVSGFEGARLVNSFHGGDGPTGTLTSPPFKIERTFLNFLIGGGGYGGKTCMNLLVDGLVVRTATGSNTQPGGSEALEWSSWDVDDLIGSEAVVQIVDAQSGGWGHVTIDHIVQSDRKAELGTIRRELLVDRPFLHLPIKNGAPKRLMRAIVDGETARQFEVELAEGEPDYWTSLEVEPFEGKDLFIELDQMPADSAALDVLTLADSLPDPDGIYRERLRPQFHFSAARGWLNDPNGLVYHEGEYHLFFQHNPFGTSWGNMTWGHAVSPDLIHWRQLAEAIHMDELGTIFSGSAVVDHNNTTGWKTGALPPIVAIYTSAGGTSAASIGQPFTQSVAYSTDRGRSFTKFEGNPVLGEIAEGNRDPKVFRHVATEQWVMILYVDRSRFGLFGSPDLKTWTALSEFNFPDGFECPDLFELPVDDDPSDTRWVAWEADGRYLIGSFDGERFLAEGDVLASRFGGNDYAAQSFSDIPAEDGRRIQISWMRGGDYPGMPFNQQMTVPRVLSLRTTPEGIRLFIEPVEEIEQLRGTAHRLTDVSLGGQPLTLDEPAGELFDIEAVIELGDAETVGLDIQGHRIEYSASSGELTALGHSAPLQAEDGRISLRILVDRTSVEVFANGGRVQLASCVLPDANRRGLKLFATGGPARVVSLNVWEVRSIWNQ